MMPTVRTTQAPVGRTPVLAHRAVHREKVSVAASLWKTQRRNQVRLHYWAYPNTYVTAEDYADYLRDLMQERFRAQPVLLLHDEGHMHWGEPVDEILEDFPLLSLEFMPTYAPELNPVEAVWNYLQCDQLANFAPIDALHLATALNLALLPLHNDQARLQSFLAASPLQW
jgi:putative transposase